MIRKTSCGPRALLGILATLAVAGAPAVHAQSPSVRSYNAAVLELQADVTDGGAVPTDAEVASTLEARAALLKDLIAKDPAQAVAIAFPADTLAELARAFPQQRASLEQRGRWQGELEYLIEDDVAMQSHRDVYRVHRAGGEVLEVHFAGREPPGLRSGLKVVVGGVRLGNAVAASELEVVEATTNDGATSLERLINGSAVAGLPGDNLDADAVAPYPAVCRTTGPQAVLSVLVNLPNYPLPAAVTPDFVTGVLMGNARSSTDHTPDWSLDDFWRQSSDGKTYVDGVTSTVVGPVTLSSNYNTSGAGGSFCDNYGLRDEVLRVLDPQVDFKRYSRIQIVMPNNGACGWAGSANVGCRILSTAGDGTFEASVAWQRADTMTTRSNAVQLTTHEIGHSLGLLHAASRDFGAEALGSPGASGSLSEYGDTFSTMGAWNLGFYAAPQAANMLGWLANGGNVQTVTTAGTYTIQNFEARPAGVKALKIRRGNASDQWLWLESRQNTGLYSSQLFPAVFGGALIHYEDAQTGGYSHLLDFTPATATFSDSALPLGQTWSDAYTNLSLTITGLTPAGMTVAVNYGAPVCTRGAPTVTLLPDVVSTDYGTSVSLNATVRSNDSAACAADTFALGSTVPSGWTPTLSQSSVTVSPGQQAQATLSVAIPNPNALGTFAVVARATGAAGQLAGSDTTNVTVTAPPPVCERAAPTLTMSPSTASVESGKSGVFTLTVRNNSSAACAAETVNLAATVPAGWTKQFSAASLSLAAGAQGSTTLTVGVPAGATPATLAVSSSATSASSGLSASASATVTVTEPPPVCEAAAPTLTMSPSTASVESGKSGVFTLTVRNNSSAACAAETVNLAATVPAGWTKQLSAAALSLAAGAQGSTTLTVGVPAGTAPASLAVSSSATSASSGLSASASASVTVTEPPPVCEAAAPTVTLSPASLSVESGKSGVFTLTVRNNSSAACAVESFTLSSAAPAGWSRQFALGALSLAPGAQGQTTLTIAVPEGFATGTQTVSASATSGTSSLSGAASAAVSVTAPPVTCSVASPTLTVSPASASVEAGQSTVFTIALRNNSSVGCGSDSFTLRGSLPVGWSASLSSSMLTVAPGQTGQATATVNVPAGYTPGNASVVFIARSSTTGLSRLAAATVTVTAPAPVCEAAAPTVTLSPASLSIESGQGGVLTLTVRNNSSAACAAETVNLAASVPAGWTKQLSAASLSLAPGAQGQATLTIGVPAGTAPGPAAVSSSATSAASQLSGTAGATVTVTEPPPVCEAAAPTVTVAPASLSIESGQGGLVTLTVRNNSSAACAAETVNLAASAPAGWTKQLSAASLSLAPGAQGQATLTLGVPAGFAPGVQAVSVTATGSSTGLVASGGTSVTVTAPPPVCEAAAPTVTVLPASLSIESGQGGLVTLTVRNNSSEACAAETVILGSAGPAGWTRQLSVASLSLAPGAQGQATLTIGVPAGFAPGVQAVSVTATGSSTGLVASGGTSVTVTAPPPVCEAAAPTLTLSPSSLSVVSGSSGQLTLTLRNNSSEACAAETFELDATTPLGWTQQFGANALSLAPGAQAQTTLTIGVPAGSATGVQSVGVIASGASAGLGAGASASVAVTAPPAVCSVAAPSVIVSPAASLASPGETVPLTMTVRNNSSEACAPERFWLRVSLPTGWTGALSATEVTIGPGQQGSVTVEVGVAANAAAGTQYVMMWARSAASYLSRIGSATVTVQ